VNIRRFYPPIAGGQDLDEMLKSLTDEIAELKQKQEAGETVDENRLKQLEGELDSVKQEQARQKAASATPDNSAIETAVAAAVKAVLADQPKPEPVPAVGQDFVKSIVDQVTENVTKSFSTQREPSSVVLEGASDEEVAKWAQTKGLTILDPSGVRVGADREVKAFLTDKESHFAKFVSMVYRQKLGIATDFDRKALAEATDGAGGYLVPQQWMDDILGLIRANAIVRTAGPRMIPFSKTMLQTSISTGATAFYIDENAPIPTSEPTFAEAVLLQPKDLTGLVPVSNSLLDDAPETEAIVRVELAEALALREDLAFLEGTGTTSQPRGFKNMTGITDMTAANVGGSGTGGAIGANGDPFRADMVRRMVARLRELNVRGARLAFFFHPAVLTQLELEKDSQGRYLADAGVLTYSNEDQSQGRIWGIPFYTTTQIPVSLTRGTATTATYVLLVNMAEAIVGINKELTIDMSNEASYWTNAGAMTGLQNAFQQRQTLFRAVMRHDINHRRKNQILLLQGIVV